jgi:hypothetical protein
MLDLLPLQRIFTAVKIDVFAILGDARNRGEVLKDRNVYRGIAERAARPGDDVTDGAHGVLSSSEVVE